MNAVIVDRGGRGAVRGLFRCTEGDAHDEPGGYEDKTAPSLGRLTAEERNWESAVDLSTLLATRIPTRSPCSRRQLHPTEERGRAPPSPGDAGNGQAGGRSPAYRGM